MGSKQSTNEKKTVDTIGTLNNNLLLGGTDVMNIYNFEIVLLLSIICVVKLIEFGYFLYRQHSKQLKKKYSNNNINKCNP